MIAREFGKELAKEMTGKAVMWGPAIVGTIFLGPLGALLGLMGSVGIAVSIISGSPSATDGQSAHKDQPR